MKGRYTHFLVSSFIMDLIVSGRTFCRDSPPDLEPWGFLQILCCPSPSSDEEEDYEPMKTQSSCYEEYVCQIKTSYGSDLSQKVVILFTMRIGLHDSEFPFFVDREPFVSLPKQNKIKIHQ